VTAESHDVGAALGLATRLPGDVREALGALSRVARALVGHGTFEELAGRALDEMQRGLGLEVAALYLPDRRGGPVLRRFVHAASPDSQRRVQHELTLEPEAWRLAVQSPAPLVFFAEGSALVDSPFDPVPDSWLALPLASGDQMLGVVIAAAPEPPPLDPLGATVLTLLGDLLGAGIATARLRQRLQIAALERERLELAAEVHDELAQDLALAARELRLLDEDPPPAEAAASRERLREAVESAHGTARARLKGLMAPAPLGGLRRTVEEICGRFAARRVPVRLEPGEEALEVGAEARAVVARILAEALANVEKHAAASEVSVELDCVGERLRLVVEDDGNGIAPGTAPRPGGGHFGLQLMHQRALAAGGRLAVEAARPHGTRIVLDLPMPAEVI
jgi:signal transduction histidine kinase